MGKKIKKTIQINIDEEIIEFANTNGIRLATMITNIINSYYKLYFKELFEKNKTFVYDNNTTINTIKPKSFTETTTENQDKDEKNPLEPSVENSNDHEQIIDKENDKNISDDNTDMNDDGSNKSGLIIV